MSSGARQWGQPPGVSPSGDPLGCCGNPNAALQSSWFIDPVGGNDVNSGATAGTAIRTHAELMARLRGQVINITVTINVLGDVSASDPFLVRLTIGDSGFVRYVGAPQATLATGTFTAVTNQSPPANQPAEVTDNALAGDWGALGLVEQRVRVVSGTVVGAIAWVAKDLTAKAARMSSWSQPNSAANPFPAQFGNVNVAVGDGYVVERLPSVDVLRIDVSCSGETVGGFAATSRRLIFDGITFNAPFDRYLSLTADNPISIAFVGCHVNGPQGRASGAAFHASQLDPFQTGGTGEIYVLDACIVRSFLNINVHTTCYVLNNTVIQGSGFSECAGRMFSVSAGFMDCGPDALRVSPMGTARIVGPVWGSGNAGSAWRVISGGKVIYTNAFILAAMTVTSAGNDALVGGTARTYAQLPYVEPNNNAMIVTYT